MIKECLGGVQLPDDARSVGYRQTRPFHYEQVFSSQSTGFTGTEQEFIAKGLAYRFVSGGSFKRIVIEGK